MTIKQTLQTIKALSPSLRPSYNSEYKEYRIRIAGHPQADYFTNDSQDAIGTAMDLLAVYTKENLDAIQAVAIALGCE